MIERNVFLRDRAVVTAFVIFFASIVGVAVAMHVASPDDYRAKATFHTGDLLVDNTITQSSATANTLVFANGSKQFVPYGGTTLQNDGGGTACTISANGTGNCNNVALAAGTVNKIPVFQSAPPNNRSLGDNLAGVTISNVSLDMNSKPITSVATPSNGTDAANKTYVDSHTSTSSGLYNGTMISPIPTQSGLGFSNWNVPAGASFNDIDQGIQLLWNTGSTPSVIGITTAAPSTPYTITAALAYSYTCGANTGNQGCIGWAQGTSGTTGSTKAEALCYTPCGAGGFQQRIIDATSATGGSFIVNQSAAYIRSSAGGLPWFVRISDDGTTVSFKISFDGIGYTTVYSVAKSSGFLGGSGYSRIFFGTWDFNNGPAYDVLLGWKATSP